MAASSYAGGFGGQASRPRTMSLCWRQYSHTFPYFPIFSQTAIYSIAVQRLKKIGTLFLQGKNKVPVKGF